MFHASCIQRNLDGDMTQTWPRRLCVCRATRYEEHIQYAIMFNIVITILLAIHKQILQCAQFCISAAFSILLENVKQKEIVFNILLLNKLNIELNIKGKTKKRISFTKKSVLHLSR